MVRRQFGAAAVLLAALLFGVVAQRALASPSFEDQVVDLVNQERAALGRAPLIPEGRLFTAAENHAQWMADNDKFSHCGANGTLCTDTYYSFTGSSVGERVTSAGYSWTAVGETLAAGQPTAEEAVLGHYCDSDFDCYATNCQSNACDGWKQSSGHWPLLMSTSYRHIGVGYVEDTDPSDPYQHWWAAALANGGGAPQRVAREITTGADGARSVGVADVDGDGDLDVLSASYSDDKIAWYANDGTSPPEWTAATISTAADGATSVVAADMDGDGDIDVLSASELDDKIAWYANTDGAGTFGSQQEISTAADGAQSVFAADLDGDGDVDVLSASYNDNVIRWYENGSTPPWEARVVSGPLSVGARSVYAADLDGDGDVDVVSASETDDRITWYQNNGASPPGWTTDDIASPTDGNAADGAASVFAADVDRDGDIDVLSASDQDDRIVWYENDGAASPGWTTRTISASADGAISVYAADLDGDGDVDVLSASALDDKIAWYENDGSTLPSWTTRTVFNLADGAQSALAADLDGDGDTDVLSASELDDTIAWYEDLTIHRSGHHPVKATVDDFYDGAWSVQVADVDGDGYTDILGAAANAKHITWWENRLDDTASCPPTCWSEHTVDSDFNSARSVYGADVDGDGDVDVLGAAWGANTITWWENADGSGTSWTAHAVDTAFAGANRVHAADVDGDGDIDVLGAASSDSDITWWENAGPCEGPGGACSSWTEHVVAGDYSGARAVYAADVDGDGNMDVLGAAAGANAITWWENDGASPPAWTERTVDGAFGGAADVHATDVDGDGDTDVLGAASSDNDITWWENDGASPPAWTEHLVDGAFTSAQAVRSADLDQDGDLDIIGASLNDLIAWWENDGASPPAWSEHTVDSIFIAARAAEAADLDRDGQLDIVGGCSGGDEVAWWQNRGGQFALATTDTAPAAGILDGGIDDLLRIEVAHRGRSGDTDVELATLELLFEESAGDPLTSAEANAIIANLYIYLDTGSPPSSAFEIGTDALVKTVATLSLASGLQTVTFTDAADNVRVVQGAPMTYFVVVELTADAGSQTPNMFRVTHVTEASSTAEDRMFDTLLDLEYAANSVSSTTPVTLAYFEATPSGDRVRFEWSTLTEVGNVGFRISELTAGGWRPVNHALVPSQVPDSLEPRDYTFEASGAGSGPFKIEDVDVLAGTRGHGPFELGQAYGARPTVETIDWAAIRGEHVAKAAGRRAERLAEVQLAIDDAVDRLAGTDGVRDTGIETAAPNVAGGAGLIVSMDGVGAGRLVNTAVEGAGRIGGTAVEGADRIVDSDVDVTGRSRDAAAVGARLAHIQLRVSTDGLYRVTYDDLEAAGLDARRLPLDRLSLTHRGKPVPIRVGSQRGANPTFGPGAYVEFYGRAADTLYTTTSVYTLAFDDAGGLAADIDRKPPSGRAPAASVYMATITVEHDREYSFGAPNGDPWYDANLLAMKRPASWTGTIEVDGYVASATPVRLDVGVWGVTDWPSGPDHHLEVRFNGQKVADRRFDGLVDYPIAIDLPSGLLVEGANTLELVAPGDTGAEWDLIAIDRFSVTYPRRTTVRDGQLTFESAEPALRVDGLPSRHIVAYRLTDDGLTLLAGMHVARSGDTFNATIPGTPGRTATYVVADVASIGTPDIVPWREVNVETGGPADYLVISHPDFIANLEPLLRARETQGLRVRVVDVEDLYAQYSGGELDPTAIRRFIAYSAANLGTRYVLLVGGDTYDYRDNLGLGSLSFVPSIYARTDRIVRYAPVDPLYGDVDGDGVPDLAVGRFPVRTSTELAVLIDKTLRYGQKDYGRTAVFVADTADAAVSADAVVNFAADSQRFSATLPEDWQVTRAHVDVVGAAGARATLLAALNDGVALTSFVGHSSPTTWTFGDVFRAADAATLSNAGRPTVVVQWGCWNTYYVAPQYDTLGHMFLLSGDRGAAAVLGAATLTQSTSEQALGRLLSGRMVAPGAALGDAMRDAKVELADAQPELTDVILGWTLLGDPALVVDPGLRR